MKERNLLAEVLANWDDPHSDPIRTDGLMERIREYLAQPEKKREVLNLAEISAAYLSEITPEYEQADADEYKWMVRGVRFAERHHGIGGEE